MPVSFDGDDISDISIDGNAVTEVTMDGDVVWTDSGNTTTSVVVEDWESSDPLSDWSGDTGDCNIDTTAHASGSQSLETTGQWRTIITASAADLNASPTQGDRFEFYVAHESTSSNCDSRIQFARQDADNFYFVHTDGNAGHIGIKKYENGESTVLAEKDFTWDAGVWQRVEVEWDDGERFGGNAGDFTVRAYTDGDQDFTEITANDTQWTSGDVGVWTEKSSNSNRVWFDGWKITDVSTNTAPNINSVSVSENDTANSDAEFAVSWDVSDADDNLNDISISLTDDTDGHSEDSVSVSVSGGSSTGSETLIAAGDDGSGNQYTVDFTVTDSEGASSNYTETVTESEPPEQGMHLDMTGSSANVDVSSHSLTVDPGQSFLVWTKPTQIGSSGHNLYPGIFSVSSTGSYDNMFNLQRDDGGSGAATSGTVQTNMAAEDSNGDFSSSEGFNVNLDSPSWHLIGFTYHSDNTMTWWHNDASITTRTALSGTGNFPVSYIGVGYGDSTNDGMGGKYMDEPMIVDAEISSSEVSDFYNNGTLPSNRANHWAFDDDSDTTTATDSSSAADGTINDSTYVEGDAYSESGATVIEDWESGSIASAWTEGSAGFSVSQSSNLEGSYLLASDGNLNQLYSNEGDGLPAYHHRSDNEALVFYSYAHTADEAVAGVYYGFHDIDNKYFVRHANGEFQIGRTAGGTHDVLAGAAASHPATTPLRWEIRWDDGTNGTVGDHELSVYNGDTGSLIANTNVNSTVVEDEMGSSAAGVGFWAQNNGNLIDLDHMHKKPW